MVRHNSLIQRLRALGTHPPREEGEDAFPCPEARILRDFTSGSLPAEKEEAVARHLLSCGDCAREVLAWDAVESRDEAALRRRALSPSALAWRLGAAVRQTGAWFNRQVIGQPRVRVAACAALAAAIVIGLFLPALLHEAPGLVSVKPVPAAGITRIPEGGVYSFSPAEEIYLALDLTKPAYVYVILIEAEDVSVVFPEGEPKRLSGTAAIPGKEERWGFDEGTYTLLVGVREDPLTSSAVQELLADLRKSAASEEAAAGVFSTTESIRLEIK